MSHRAELGKDARGNLIRIDNVLNSMEGRKQAAQERLDNLYAQMEAAKAEIGKPFPQEEELRTKSARLAVLNAELNIDERSSIEQTVGDENVVAKSSRPSVLAQLKQPLKQDTAETSKPKSKQKEL